MYADAGLPSCPSAAMDHHGYQGLLSRVAVKSDSDDLPRPLGRWTIRKDMVLMDDPGGVEWIIFSIYCPGRLTPSESSCHLSASVPLDAPLHVQCHGNIVLSTSRHILSATCNGKAPHRLGTAAVPSSVAEPLGSKKTAILWELRITRFVPRSHDSRCDRACR